MKTGKLIVIEGTDGAGKTTASGIILNKLKEAGRAIESVNILSSNKESLFIRTLLTNTASDLDPDTEVLLYIAAVNQTYKKVILPLLEQGIDVLCDRGPMSSFVYQCKWQERLGNKLPAQLHELAFKNFKMDSFILVTTRPEVGLERCRSRSGDHDRLESRGLEYFQNIVEDYRAVAGRLKESVGDVFVIENDSTLEELEKRCNETVTSLLK